MLRDEGLDLLTEPECYDLLASGSIGRVGVTVGALPVILPVNYRTVERDVVFRTSPGTKLRAALDHAVIAFEVDALDAERRSGWSVLVVGRAREVVDPDEVARLDALDLAPWAGDAGRDRWVRLHPEFVSGRRIPHALASDGDEPTIA
ncbi:MAG TPA: pyridoxamine 5'-phosphate oxidase family protein [Acidimicrobiia bacterium]|nr:pyridoxamine 5'-phosphate oxidase family protein [Acidimicrobiia bacterium]